MDEVLYEKRGLIAWITINRPQRRNSITSAVVNVLRANLSRANHDHDVRAIVLTGAGDTVFCAGGDLGRDQNDAGVISRYDANRDIVDLLIDINQLQKPILARVNGHALGIGLAILLACDLALACPDVRLGCPELKVGLFPMLILALLQRHVGPKKAQELVLTAQQVTAAQAEKLGMLNAVVAREELDAKVDDLLGKIADFSPAAIRLGREAFQAIDRMSYAESMQYLLAQHALNMQTEDAREGVLSFLQKRKPEWKGR